jgi:hypothetical protein
LGAIAELFGPKYRKRLNQNTMQAAHFCGARQEPENCETQARVSSIVC